jgi:hypothetical protein
MSNYTVTTNFANKDSLPSGSSDKIIRGSEFTAEFTNISTAVNSKVDSTRVLTDVPSGAVFTDTVYTKPTNEPISYITGLQTALDDGATPWNVNSGFISIYTDDTYGGISIFDNGVSGGAHYIKVDHTASLPNSYYAQFSYQGVTAGSISRSGTTGVAYNTSSDYRLKENVAPVDNAAARVKALKPCRFNFIGEERTVDGFLAHEAQEVVPESVTGDKDAVDADGKPMYQGIDQSKLVPLLTAALQEALERIEALESVISGGV